MRLNVARFLDLLLVSAIALPVFAVTPDPTQAQPYKPNQLGQPPGRHKLLNHRAEQADRVDVVFIGDSITHYWESRGAKVWKQYFGDLNALNLGVEGDRTWNVLWRLQNGNLKELDPKVAVLLIGTNNIGLSKHQAGPTAEGVKAVVDYLRQRLPKTRILLMGLFPRGRKDGWGAARWRRLMPRFVSFTMANTSFTKTLDQR